MTKEQLQLAREIEVEYGLALTLLRRADRLLCSAVVRAEHGDLRGPIIDLANQIGRLHDQVIFRDNRGRT